MDSARLNNVIIIILLALNLCFAGLIVKNRLDVVQISKREKEELSSIFSAGGITLNADDIPENTDIWQYSFVRDTAAETDMVSALIGAAESEDRGGNIYYYENERGSALFRNNGEFEIYFNSFDSGDEKSVDKLLKRLGFEADSESGGEKSSVSYSCGLYGAKVLRSFAELSVSDDGSAKLTGRRINGTPQRVGDSGAPGINTVLISFLDGVKSGGYVCTSVEDIELCYMLSYSAAQNRLDPVWRIVTNSGDYLVNALSGEMVA